MGNILGVRVTPTGDTIGSFPICNRPNAQFGPSITFDGTNFLCVWTDRSYSGTHFWTVAARVTPQGAVIDSGNCIGSTAAYNEFYPDIAWDGNRSLVVWYHSFYEPYGIFGRFVNSDALPEDTVLRIASTQQYLYNFPKVAYGDSAYLVVWADVRNGYTDYDIFGQVLSLSGEHIGDRIVIATGSQNQRKPHLAFSGMHFLVVWIEAGLVYGQRISTNGQFIGSRFRISDATPFARSYPHISAGETNYLVVWCEERGTQCDIYGNVDVLLNLQEQRHAPVSECSIPSVMTSSYASRQRHRYEFYDCAGRKIMNGTLSPGVYFVRYEQTMKFNKVVVVR